MSSDYEANLQRIAMWIRESPQRIEAQKYAFMRVIESDLPMMEYAAEKGVNTPLKVNTSDLTIRSLLMGMYGEAEWNEIWHMMEQLILAEVGVGLDIGEAERILAEP